MALDNAGPIGREMADKLAEYVIAAVEGFPASTDRQQPAILRLCADMLYDHADGMEAK